MDAVLLGSAETNKSSEIEVAENVPKLASGGTVPRQPENGNHEISTIGTLLRQMVETPAREISSLIDKLEMLRKKLQTDCDRIQRDIAEYFELSLHVMQLTPIISDCVKKPQAVSVDKHEPRLGDQQPSDLGKDEARRIAASFDLLRSAMINF